MKIEQNQQISISALKALAASGMDKSHIHIHMNAVQIGADQGDPSRILPEDIALLNAIECFPPPRLENFIKHIYRLVEGKFAGDKFKVAHWLDCSERTVRRRRIAYKE